MVLPIRISASSARDEVAWIDSSAMAANAAEHAAVARLSAGLLTVSVRIMSPLVSIGAASAQRLKTLSCFQRSEVRRARVPGAGLRRVALHADRPQVCEHRGIERPRQDKRGFRIAGFRDERQYEARAGYIAQGNQVPAAFQQGRGL